ncbi:MAG: phosphoribosylformylglycinamidine synthase subunit PurQ [Cryomorphaceae bacterium]
MKFGVIIFPGSNCDEDLIYTFETILGQEVERLWHKDTDLKGVDFVLVPGGFSYGDYLRSGAIARFSPIMDSVIEHCRRGGYALGICNGFQILCEAGLLPGALLPNTNHQFICRNIYMKAATRNTILTAGLESDQVLKIPIAHAEGRYYASSDDLKKLNENEQVIFRYCERDGSFSNAANPNGSLENIAGVCNAGKNVFGMMPHPERAADEVLGNTDGRLIFESVIKAVQVV